MKRLTRLAKEHSDNHTDWYQAAASYIAGYNQAIFDAAKLAGELRAGGWTGPVLPEILDLADQEDKE